MPKKQDFSKILGRLLSTRATCEECEQLLAAGFNLKAPTKRPVVMAALYKKAAAGDLSAIKELLLRLSPDDNRDGKGVVFIDDIKNTDK